MRYVVTAVVSIASLALLAGAAAAKPAVFKRGGIALGKGEKLAHHVYRGDLGPSKKAAVVLVTHKSKRGFFGYVVAGKKRYRLPMPAKDIAGSMQWRVEAVAFINVDKDRAKELVVMTSYLIGAGPQAAVPQPFNYLFDYHAKKKRFVRLLGREKPIRYVRTAKKLRRLLKASKR